MKRIKKGFTVIELIITIIVVAVLAAVLIPSFTGFASSSKLTGDKVLVNNLNNAITIYKQSSRRKIRTMHDAVLAVKRGGYTLDKLVTTSDQDLVFSVNDYKFHLSGDIEAGKEYECFKIYSSMPNYTSESKTWSIYASENFEQKTISNLNVGFDVGYNQDIEDITYIGSKHVLINTYEGKLSINTLTGGVSHFGNASVVDILEVSNNSYFEEGKTDFIRLAKGRAVITPSSNVNGIHILENSDSYSSKVAVIDDTPLPNLTRDKVSEDNSKTAGTYDKYICELQKLDNREDIEPEIEHLWLRVNVVSSVATPVALVSSSNEEITEIPEEEISPAALAAKESLTIGRVPETTVEDTFINNGYSIKTGNVYYETIGDAFLNGKSKKTYTIIQDCSINENISLNKEITLDLNGKTVTFGSYTLTLEEANLTLKDSLSNGKISGSASPIISGSNSALRINSGSIVTSGAIAVNLELSKFYLTGGLVQAKYGCVTLVDFAECELSGGRLYSSTGSSSYYTLKANEQTEYKSSEVIIRGTARIDSKKSFGVIASKLSIYENPTITSAYYALRIAGVTNINGGTITTTGSYHSINIYTSGLLTITGGTITPKSGYKYMTVTSTGTGLVSTNSSPEYLGSAHIVYQAEIYESDGTTLAYYGSTYGSVKNSRCANKIIKMNSNISLTAAQYIYFSQSVTLDLNGHSITQATEAATSAYLFRITAANVTIKGDGVCSYLEPDSLNDKSTYLFYLATTAVCNINIEGGTYIYNGNKESRPLFYVYSNVSGSNVINFKGGTFGSPTYPTAVFLSIRSSTYYKRVNINFSGGSYYNYDSANHGTKYKINIVSGYSSVLNSETGYYDIVANS